ncbi:glycine zipper 2TM domain-containing protein [Novosphingopyxis iocasae]|uniref:glycine zipper 2TM domain-containing protein n=1 Tax=Novosphingopyxis iocasae TaxID=2762729 RepID=UPI001650DD20|nr:glycine zipper 2TM domain-containing protein [Novosphingopyxis iocasae]
MNKNLCLWTVAAPALLAATPAIAGHDSPDSVPYGAEYGPTATYDDGAYNWDDRVYSQEDQQSGTYDGTWSGNYVDDQGRVYQGEWQGTYVDENGQAFQGSYRGTSIGAPRYGYETNGVATAPYAGTEYQAGTSYQGAPAYQGTPAYQGGYVAQAPGYGYEQRQDNGVGGAVIGGVAGGVAGNLIAGRGNRLAGTLIGGGLGAAAGYAIDKAEDRGQRRYYRDDRRVYGGSAPVYRGPAPAYGGAYAQGARGYAMPTGYGWQGHRYWYRGYAQPQAYNGGTTTVVVVPGQTTTTTTTTVTEEYVSTGHDKRVIRKDKRLRR